MSETDPGPSIAAGMPQCLKGGECPHNDPQTEREGLQELLVQQQRGHPHRRSGQSNTDESNGKVGLTDRQRRRILRDPEVRKNIEILAARLSDAIDLGRRQPVSAPKVTNRLNVLLREPRNALCLETLLETRRSVEELLLECADLSLLRQRTTEEFAEQEATLPTWIRLYGAELPEILSDCPESSSSQVQESTRRRLQRLVAARFSLYRPLRARRRLRIIYLRYIGPVLLLAGLLFGFAIGFQHQVGVRALLLAAAAGASGAALSGLLKFRDEVKLGTQVREFLPFYLVQVVVGAVFGLFIDLVFAAGWLKIGPSVAGIGVLAFAAGFSEPFAIGIVAKMTERASI
jgi:hypothetical protein